MTPTIPLAYAIRLLQEASAIIIDDSVVTFAGADADQEPFMTLAWEADEGYFEYDFYACDNEVVDFAGGSMWLVPTNPKHETEEPLQISLLEPMNLERIVADMIAIEKQDQ